MTMLNHVYTVDAATALDADAIRHIHARGYVRTNAALCLYFSGCCVSICHSAATCGPSLASFVSFQITWNASSQCYP